MWKLQQKREKKIVELESGNQDNNMSREPLRCFFFFVKVPLHFQVQDKEFLGHTFALCVRVFGVVKFRVRTFSFLFLKRGVLCVLEAFCNNLRHILINILHFVG